MDVSPCVSGLKGVPGAVGGVVLSGALSLEVHMGLSGWMYATLLLFDHELGYDVASAQEYIRGKAGLGDFGM